MYNIMHGRNQHTRVILAMLGLDEGCFGRFRDVHIAAGEIAVYTRCGGGNREAYNEYIDCWREHPNYLRDKDDDFDSTYATVYFSVPGEFKELAAQLETGKWEPDALWASKLESRFCSVGVAPSQKLVYTPLQHERLCFQRNLRFGAAYCWHRGRDHG